MCLRTVYSFSHTFFLPCDFLLFLSFYFPTPMVRAFDGPYKFRRLDNTTTTPTGAWDPDQIGARGSMRLAVRVFHARTDQVRRRDGMPRRVTLTHLGAEPITPTSAFLIRAGVTTDGMLHVFGGQRTHAGRRLASGIKPRVENEGHGQLAQHSIDARQKEGRRLSFPLFPRPRHRHQTPAYHSTKSRRPPR